MAATVVLAVAAHAVTPFSAGGDHGPTMFGPQLRFLAAPALLGAVLAAMLVPLRHRRWLVGAAVAYAASSVASFAGVAAGVGFAALLVAASLVRSSPFVGSRPLRLATAGVVAALLLAAAPVAAAHRYDDPGRNATWAVFGMFRHVRGARVAVGVFRHTYPLAGPDLTNHVQLVGSTRPRGGFRPARTREEWVREVLAGRYDYVVVGRTQSVDGRELVQSRWTRTIPGAVRVYRDGTTEVFRLAGGEERSLSAAASPGGARTRSAARVAGGD